jgi:ferredoxin
MITSYGYEDGSGFYYITVDTEACANCPDFACVDACEANVLGTMIDDYDDLVVVVDESARKHLREICTECKRQFNEGCGSFEFGPPCLVACGEGGLTHSW